MYEKKTCKTHEKRQGREKVLLNNQIITARCIELQVYTSNDHERKINYDWPNLTLARQFWATKVCLWASKKQILKIVRDIL